MMHFVKNVAHLRGYLLVLKFEDGISKQIDLEPFLDGEIFAPLRELAYFGSVKVHPELDTIYWENGADFSPDFLFENGETISELRAAA